MKTYIEKIDITQCGVLKNTTINFTPNKINLIYGENESGKTTLMELIRYGFYDAGKKHKITTITDKNAEIYINCLSYPCKITLTDKKRTITPKEAPLNSLPENISRENYKNIFAFGQYELFNIRYRDIFGSEKNAILTATGIDFDTDLNKIHKDIVKSYEGLYKPKGKVTIINKFLSESKRLAKESKKIAAKLKENENIFGKLEEIQSELVNKKKTLENYKKELSELRKLLQPFDSYSDFKEKTTELKNLENATKIDNKTFSEIQDKKNEIKAISDRIQEINNNLAATEEEIKYTQHRKNNIDLQTANKLLKTLETNLDLEKNENTLNKNYANARHFISSIKEKLDINELAPEVLEEDVISRLNEINNEYHKATTHLEQTQMLLKSKTERLGLSKNKINKLLNSYEHNFSDMEKDWSVFKKNLENLNINQEKITKIDEEIASLEVTANKYRKELHDLLLEKKDIFEKTKKAAEFKNHHEDIANYAETIKYELSKTGKSRFPGSIKFTSISLLLFLLTVNFTEKLNFIYLIPAGIVADLVNYFYNKKHEKNLKNITTKVSEVFGLTGAKPEEMLNELKNLQLQISTAESLQKELAPYGINYENFMETFSNLEEKKSEAEANKATINKLSFDKRMLESEIANINKNIRFFSEKYNKKNKEDLNAFFNKANENFKIYNDLSNELKTLEYDISDLGIQKDMAKNKISKLTDDLAKILDANGQESFSPEKMSYLLSNKQELRQSFEEIREYHHKKEYYEDTRAFLRNSLINFGIVSTDFENAYAELDELIKHEEKIVQELENLNHQLRNYSKEKAVNEKKLNKNNEQYNYLLENNRLKDVFDAENALQNYQNYQQLANKLTNEEELFYKRYGFKLKEYEKILNKESYTAIKQKTEIKQDELEELNDSLNQLYAEEARVKEVISNLADKTELMENQKMENYYSRKIKEYAKEYITYKTAETILNKSIKRFEEESQPELLEKASEYFNTLTKGKYEKIKLDIANNLYLIDSNRNSLDAGDLSAGTQDQLYISLRLAYIQMLDKKFIMPLIFDETIINFDDKRQDAFLNSLGEIAGNRQIIFFTCHKTVKDKFLNTFSKINLQELENEDLTFTA